MQQGSTCVQIFLTYFNFFHFRGLTSKKLAHIALAEFFEIFGVPRQIHIDNAKELMSAPNWRRVWEKQAGLQTTQIEPHSLWQNSAEQGVRTIKRGGARLMRNTDAPAVLWEWVLDYEAEG